MKKDLTILITTYNRKERLLNMLRSIEQQKLYDNYQILISDNNSDYNIQKCIEDNFQKEFVDIITVHSWQFNIGMNSNISISLALVNTPWCLFLSDDDEMTRNSIQRILDDIKRYPYAIALKYSLLGRVPYPDFEIFSIEQFISFYENNPSKTNEMYYLSRVYNLKLLDKNCIYFTEYSYTYISFLVPLIFALRDKLGCIKVSSFETIDYKICPPGENWYYNEKYIKTFLGIGTFADLLLDISAKQRRRLMRVVFSFLEMPHAVKCLNGCINKEDRWAIYPKIYYINCICKPYRRFIHRKIYYYYILFRIAIHKILFDIYHQLKNKH